MSNTIKIFKRISHNSNFPLIQNFCLDPEIQIKWTALYLEVELENALEETSVIQLELEKGPHLEVELESVSITMVFYQFLKLHIIKMTFLG